jgi:hypothetical protein
VEATISPREFTARAANAFFLVGFHNLGFSPKGSIMIMELYLPFTYITPGENMHGMTLVVTVCVNRFC